MAKDCVYQLRLSKEDKAELTVLSSKAGLPLSQYIHKKLFPDCVITKPDVITNPAKPFICRLKGYKP